MSLAAIAKKANGNIALGINLLKLAAINAESKGKRAIDESDIPENDCSTKLSPDEKILLNILRRQKSLPASRLCTLYLQKGERSFRNYMRNLNELGLVKAIGEKRGRTYELVENASGCEGA